MCVVEDQDSKRTTGVRGWGNTFHSMAFCLKHCSAVRFSLVHLGSRNLFCYTFFLLKFCVLKFALTSSCLWKNLSIWWQPQRRIKWMPWHPYLPSDHCLLNSINLEHYVRAVAVTSKEKEMKSQILSDLPHLLLPLCRIKSQPDISVSKHTQNK